MSNVICVQTINIIVELVKVSVSDNIYLQHHFCALNIHKPQVHTYKSRQPVRNNRNATE